MILDHLGKRPNIAPSARIAPNAAVRGNVSIGESCSIDFGAVRAEEESLMSDAMPRYAKALVRWHAEDGEAL